MCFRDYLIDQENLENAYELFEYSSDQLNSEDEYSEENEEEWKTIEDYPNYQISNLGRVLNIRTGKLKKQQENNNGYYYVNLYKYGKKKKNYIHRLIGQYFIDNLNNLLFIDHINNNKTDNRISNLRFVTQSQNSMNATKRQNTTSQYKGVSFNKTSQKWRTRIIKDGEEIYLGYFDNEMIAAQFYDQAAKELFGEYAKLDFSY